MVIFELYVLQVASIFTARKRSLGQGNIFTPVCHSVHGGGACVVAPGGMHGCSRGHAWLLRGGACVVAQGACVVAPGGACMVALGGVHGCSGGHAWLLQGGMHGCSRGVCGCSGGGMHGCSQGGMHGCSQGGHAWDTTRYGDTINERAVRILLECILVENLCWELKK